MEYRSEIAYFVPLFGAGKVYERHRRQMKSLIVTFLLLGSFPLSASAQYSSPSPKPQLVSEELARAIFNDARVSAYLSVTAKEFGGKCVLPDYKKTEAKVTGRGRSDFSVGFYELNIPCPGDHGLESLTIVAEFSPPLLEPLNLILSLNYKR
jgi:hypothetical protein